MAIYGDGKHNSNFPTKPKKYISRKPKGLDKNFDVLGLCKSDILGLEKQDESGNIVPKFKPNLIKKLNKRQMERISSKLGDALMEDYWISLEIIVENELND